LYQFAARSLSELGKVEDIPFFQATQSIEVASDLKKDMRTWNEEEVLKWISAQRFAIYEGIFRSSWIDGQLLAALTDGDLHEIGVANPIHR
jgi:hypothetical protein